MKISFVVIIPENLSTSAPQKAWRDKLLLLSSLGYDGIELAIKNTKAVDLKIIEKSITKSKLELPAIGTGLAYVEDRLSLSSPDKNIRLAAIERIKWHIDFAEVFKSQVIIGLMRGKLGLDGSKTQKKCFSNLKGSFGKICDYAAKKNIIIAVEPINRFETTFLNTTEETVNFIKELKCSNLKILLDTFHMNIEEKNFSESFSRAAKYISHIHFADSNRKCPGDGHIDFAQILDNLKSIGYDKYLSAEILLIPDFKKCAQRYLGYLKNIREGLW